MLIVGIILCYLLGYSVVLSVSKKFSWPEAAGFSFLIGIGIETVFLFVLDVVQLQYSQFLLIALNLLAILLLAYKHKASVEEYKQKFAALKVGLTSLNYVAVFLFCLIACLFYAITVKNLYWPPTATDTITSFDKLGRIMAIEGKLKVSLFQYNLQGAAGVYPPLFHGSFAYVYIFGAVTPKIVITLFFLSLLLIFYQAAKNYVGSTGAMLFTLILMATPEMYAHAALALGNMPTAAYICAAVLSTYMWLDKNDEKYFWMGAVMMGLSVWIRSDIVAFVFAALLVAGLHTLTTKSYRQLFIYSVFALLPFVVWLLYVKLKIQLPQASRFDLGVGYSANRLGTMYHYIKAYLFGFSYREVDGGQLYGIAFVGFFIALIINAGLGFKKGMEGVFGRQGLLLLLLLVAFVLYCAEFYFINETVQASTLASLMASSFKRGMFYFIPITVFYMTTCYSSKILFDRLEKFRTGD